jgi:hypothetical protein
MSHVGAIGSDSQALVKALDNQQPHVGHYILDKIHNMVEFLHVKQDGLINQEEKEAVIQAGDSWKGKTKGIIDLQIHWVPGHKDFPLNKQANKEVKKVAQGQSSDAKLLPSSVRSFHSAFPLFNRNIPNFSNDIGRNAGRTPCNIPCSAQLIAQILQKGS